MPTRLIKLALLGTALISGPLHAQLRGTVRATDGSALSGAVVTVLDSSGASRARTITDASGAFALTLSPRAATVRVMRIGYRPREYPIPSASSAPLQLVMEKIPPMLDAVRVSGSELCPGSTDQGAAFQLWDQARAGLLATIVAREQNPAMARTVIFESHLQPTDERVISQTKRVNVGRTTKPFVSAEQPSYFAAHGFVIDGPSERIYNGPDADVLLDESFATTHCFRPRRADASHADQVGVAFAPAPGRDTLMDVTGIIWLDATTPQLRSLDFQYTSLERAAMDMKTGGHIQFRTMPNGASFIERWVLRFPAMQMLPNTPSARSRYVPKCTGVCPGGRPERSDVRIAEIVEVGGVVLDARWEDSLEWHDPPTILRGAVMQKERKEPVANAIVFLEGTQDTTRTNADGGFELQPLPGKYSVRIVDSAYNRWVQSRITSETVDVPHGKTTLVSLQMNGVAAAIDEICKGQIKRVGAGATVILGRAVASDGSKVRNASITATWRAEYFVALTNEVAFRQERRESEVGDDGQFVVCGVIPEREVKLVLKSGKDIVADTSMRAMTHDPTFPFDWLFTPKSSPRP